MPHRRVLAAALAASALALGACASEPPLAPSTPTVAPTISATPSATARPTATPSPAAVTPSKAAELIRTTVTGARPLLVPNAVPGDWTAEVRASANAFTAVYRDPTGAKTLTLMIAAANPPLPDARATQASPSFHGDRTSLYQVADGTNAKSDRYLLWIETGVWAEPGPSGVPYYLVGNGLTDAEFWQLANSLHPNQI